MEETADRPKWLLELENRKRKPRLAHEAGAGSPCMVCNNACPGLDLHFWRKICKNCKCSRDDHDVQDDDFPQFHLLFGPSNKYRKKPVVLRVNEKQNEAETAFEWVPPDTTKELASDYMKALPADKLPIKGSAGAALRRQLLQKQLPLHDIDYKACDELSDDEKKQFETYLENIKKHVGQGKVIKILSARPFDRALMTPANATDMQHCSPDHKYPGNSNFTQLRTPSSFTKSLYGKNLANSYHISDQVPNSDVEGFKDNNRNAPTVGMYSTINNPKDTTIVTSEPVCGEVARTSSPFHKEKSLQQHIENVNYSSLMEPCQKEDIVSSLKGANEAYESSLQSPASAFAESVLADALLPPSTVRANEIIGSTLDPKGLLYIREKLENKYSVQDNKKVYGTPTKCQDLKSKEPHLTNTSGATSDKGVHTGVNSSVAYPSSGIPATFANTSNKAINKNREYPTISEKISKPNTEIIKSVPIENPVIQKEKYYPHQKGDQVSKICKSSNETIDTNAQVQSQKAKDLSPARLCDKSLAANLSHLHNMENQFQAKLSSSSIPTNLLYSEEVHNQIFPHGPINAVKDVTQNVPNVEHLRGAMEELSVGSSKPQKCSKCEEEIRIGDVVVVTEKAKNAAWHPGCFTCNVCNELLADLVYFHYKNKLYCGRDLATLLGIPRCFACDELIFVREYTVAEGHNYHVKHFCCWDCDIPLAGKEYITENDRPLCLPCYQTSYAKTCKACGEVIAASQQGVSVKDLDFHATESCFCCYECKKNLLNCRMAIKQGKLFCSKECISSFLTSHA